MNVIDGLKVIVMIRKAEVSNLSNVELLRLTFLLQRRKPLIGRAASLGGTIGLAKAFGIVEKMSKALEVNAFQVA